MRKTVSILGSTGSIGKQALNVITDLSDKFNLFGLAAGANIEVLKEQIIKYKPKVISVRDKKSAQELKKYFPGLEILFGKEGLEEIAGSSQNDIVLIAVSGTAGLYPTIAAINNNIDVALANKETLVSAGSLVMNLAKEKNVNIIPVDSEHSAIYQCISSKDKDFIRKLIITGSGGPFRTKHLNDMQYATVKQALAHPRWSMGSKITIDSATLMNKGLEVIEAHWLFNIDYKDINVVIHPQSIIHSAVEFLDGSVIAQMGVPSMHIPIQYALTYPQRCKGLKSETLNLVQISCLDFAEPDLNRFPCLKLAYQAGKSGQSYPTVLNALNEIAVEEFLSNKIKLTDIPNIVEEGLNKHTPVHATDLNEIISADEWGRNFAKDLINKYLVN